MRRHSILLCLIVFISPFVGASPVGAEPPSKDTDGDWWPDEYERRLGTDPHNPDSRPKSLDDPDQDGLKNDEELNVGTDPTKPDTDADGLSDTQEVRSGISDPSLADTDQDGLSDFDEVISGTNPRRPDTDGDGWLDSAEKRAGTDPNDPTSMPKGL